MPGYYIFQSTKNLEGHLKKFRDTKPKNNKFINFGELSADAYGLLEKYSISEVEQYLYDEKYRNQFLEKYIDLIGSIGKEQNSRAWWATDIASKNRFTSNLPFLLHQFLTVIRTIEHEDYDHLIILKPSWVIMDSVIKFLEKNKIQYLCFGECPTKWKDIYLGHCKGIWSILTTVLRVTYRKIYFKNKLKHINKVVQSRSKASYVIKTFIYDHSLTEDGKYQDSFFGTLPEFLKEKKNVLIYANIVGNKKLCSEKIGKCTSYTIIPIENTLSYTDIFCALIMALFCKIKIGKDTLFFGYDISNIISNELLRTYKGIPFYQFLHYWSTKKLLHKVSIGTFLLTYENNPWEKMCMMAIRKYSPKTIILGYQHTVVPQASANMFISSKEHDVIPKPDKILTVGETPKEIMEKYGNYQYGMIEASCGLRFEYLTESSRSERKRSGNILVVLEGIFEVYKMVNYVLRELQGSTNYQVVIRAHPVLPLNRISHKLDYLIDDIPNLTISRNNSLKKDLEWAEIVIYWGSTVALEALSFGKPVLHYEIDSILSYDPLFECQHLKRVVSNKISLFSTIDALYSLDDYQYNREQKKAKSYLNRYFYSVTEEELNKFL